MSSKNRVLVFPASQYQIDAIREAQDMGFEVLTFDNAPNNPGHRIADYSAIIDVRDIDAVLDLASRHNIVGAASVCSDISLLTLAALCERRKLRGPSVRMIEILTRKSAFREWQARTDHGPLSYIASSETESLPDGLDGLGDYLVVKPDIASGSKGISIVPRHGLRLDHLRLAAVHSLNRSFVIEKHVAGRHGTLEGYISNGCLAFAAITDRIRNPMDRVGTVGHFFPGRFSGAERESITSSVMSIYAAFDYTDGPVDCDFVVNETGVKILETSPRLGGNALSRLISIAFGISLTRIYLKYQLCQDMEIPVRPIGRPTAVWLITSNTDGSLHYEPQSLHRLKQIPWIAHVEIDVQPGSPVRAFKDGRDRIGEIILHAQTADEAFSRYQYALRTLNFAVTPHRI